MKYIEQEYFDHYKIINITHLDKYKPIYVLQDGNYRVYGKPEEYLTHSDDNFNQSDLDDWKKQCTVTIQ